MRLLRRFAPRNDKKKEAPRNDIKVFSSWFLVFGKIQEILSIKKYFYLFYTLNCNRQSFVLKYSSIIGCDCHDLLLANLAMT